MLAADAELDVRAGTLAFCNSEADQAAYTVLVQTSERIGLEDLLVEVSLQNAAHVITGEAVGHLGEVVGAEGEELRFLGHIACGDCGTRRLDHRADHILHLQAGLLNQLVSLSLDNLLYEAQLIDLGYQRNHDLRRDMQVVFLPDVDSCGYDSLGLHLGDLRIENVQTAAAGTQHRVELVQAFYLALELVEGYAHLIGQLLDLVILVREELMERRVKQTDGYRQAAHRAVNCLKVAALHRQDLGQSRLALLERIGNNHLTNRLDAGRLEEHMLGTAEADAFCAELAGLRCITRGIAVGANVQGANLVSPAHEAAEVAGQLSLLRCDLAEVYVAGGAVERNNVTLVHYRAIGKGQGLILFGNLDAVYACYTAGAHATGYYGCVRGHAAAGGHDAFGYGHAVDILRRGLLTDEDRLDSGLVGLSCSICGEVNRAAGCTGRCRQAGGDRRSCLESCRIERRVQKCVKLLCLDLHNRLLLGADAFVYQINRYLERCLCGALAVTGLQHVELAVFDGELHILHIAVMLFKAAGNVNKLLINLRHGICQRGDRLRGADAGYNVLALCIHQELAVQLLFAGGRVAGEGYAGARGLAHIAEYHGLYVYSSAPAVRDVVHAAVGVRTRIIPRAEYRADSLHQLLLRVLREIFAEGLLVVILEQNDQLGHIVRVQFIIHLNALFVLYLVDKLLEGGLRQLHNNVREHLNETAVGIACETRVIGQLGNCFADLVVHAEVKDGIHHAGHGCARTRTNGYEQRALGIAESLAGGLFELIEVLQNLILNIRINSLAVLIITGAGLGGDGETLRHRHAQSGHFSQIGTLAAKQLTHFSVALREHVNILFHLGISSVSIDALSNTHSLYHASTL